MRIILNKDRKATIPIHMKNVECVIEISIDPKARGTRGINSNCSNGLEIIKIDNKY